MTDPNFKPFSEYRHKDYVTPRSMKEAYGYDIELHTEEEPPTDYVALGVLFVLVLLFAAYAVYVLFV